MAVNPDRRIHVSWSISRWNAGRTDGIRVRIEADSAELMSSKVFAYQTLPLNPVTSERVAQFDHICSPVDLEEYPEDEPLDGSLPAWFRLDYVDVLLRSRAEADDFLAYVLGDIRSLKATLDTMDTLDVAGEEWITSEPEDEVSSSSSSA